MPRDIAFVSFGGRAQGVHTIQARSAGRETSAADPPVTRLPHSAYLDTSHSQPAPRRPRGRAHAVSVGNFQGDIINNNSSTIITVPNSPALFSTNPTIPCTTTNCETDHSNSYTASAAIINSQPLYFGHRRETETSSFADVPPYLHEVFDQHLVAAPTSLNSLPWRDGGVLSSDSARNTGRRTNHAAGTSISGNQETLFATPPQGNSSQQSSHRRDRDSRTATSIQNSALPSVISPISLTQVDAVLAVDWLQAASRGDIAGMTLLVRDGYRNVAACHPVTRMNAVHMAAALAREDCLCAVYELSLDVARSEALPLEYRQAFARSVCSQIDENGQNALHHVATVSDTAVSSDQISGTVRRLLSYGLSPFVSNSQKKTPLALARILGNRKVAHALAFANTVAGG